METKIVADLPAFRRMRDEWNELATRTQSPLLRHEWFAASAEHSPLHAIIVRSGGKLRAAAPLMATRQLGVPQLRILGYDQGEPGGLLYDSEEALEMLLESILMTRHSFTLTKFNTATQEIGVLEQMLPKFSVRINFNPRTSLWVPLKDRWEDFEATMSAKRRSDLRRYHRRAERHGEVVFEAVSPDVDTLSPHLEELFRLEAAGWKGRSGTAILSSKAKARFYHRYATTAAEAGMLRMFRLKIGGKTAATRMAVVHGGRMWDLRIAYDEALSECAPGILLTHESMRQAVGEGLEAYEFLGKAEDWERLWPCQEHHYRSVKVYPCSVSGGLSVVQDGCRSAAKRMSYIIQKYAQTQPAR
jgi:CelD/BcsL family acetyltransferase involved in cellulose biosynthesis